MAEPHPSARLEEEILSLVEARAAEAPLSALEAARLALRLKERLERKAGATVAEGPSPRVPVEESVHDNYLVCLETGERLVLLKRHLEQKLEMTPEEYRRKWHLPKDYPMAARAYRLRKEKKR